MVLYSGLSIVPFVEYIPGVLVVFLKKKRDEPYPSVTSQNSVTERKNFLTRPTVYHLWNILSSIVLLGPFFSSTDPDSHHRHLYPLHSLRRT